MIRGPVIVGVDYSPTIASGANWIRTLAPTADVTVVHAAERASVPRYLRAIVPEAAFSMRDAAEEAARLRAWADAHSLEGARAVVREGRADVVLLDVAHELAATAIVIGAHGGRERPWMRLGTAAERLLRTADTTLLVLRGRIAEAPRRIVVAVDDVEITEHVLTMAGDLAGVFAAQLTAVHVLSNAAYSHMLSMEAAETSDPEEKRRKLEADMAAEALRWLRALWRHTGRHDDLAVEIPHGVAGDEILRVARRDQADLIVIGRYGVGRAVPAFFGSVVGSIVQGAECPVLVVSS